ncbi:hypothetical protein ACG97_15165 [Vogesella sp. EB]|uniref:VOC family protein n=1 Tax=Vogesella sp. EB TaxID=1526735 RepID=UPI00064D50B4|nr:VOC family protein [Vogesella sp. EB]KMJ52111.1 hypothetical protein ACG97_15165 [Vogesella sp. EB]
MSAFVHWFEIPATDFERAVAFYRQTFHVELHVEPFMGEQIAVFRTAGGEHPGCIMTSPRLQPGSAGSRVYLDGGPDLDALLARIQAAGGVILQPRLTLPDGNGDIALFQDSEGNHIGLHHAP